MRKVKAFVPLGNPQFKITTAYYEPNKRARKPWAIKRRPKNHFCAYCWKIVNCVGAVCDGVPLSGGERSCFIATQGDLGGTKGFFGMPALKSLDFGCRLCFSYYLCEQFGNLKSINASSDFYRIFTKKLRETASNFTSKLPVNGSSLLCGKFSVCQIQTVSKSLNWSI